MSEKSDRERLREQAKVRGINVRRGASAKEIEGQITERFREDHDAILKAKLR